MTEKEKMLSGQLYNPNDKTLLKKDTSSYYFSKNKLFE